MRVAAVSELKASLSEYLAGLKEGEEVLVTDRGNPIAKLIPVSRREGSITNRVLTLEKHGLARIGTNSIPDEFWQKSRVKDKNNMGRKYLEQERSKGR